MGRACPSVDVTACAASPTSAARGPWKRAQATTAPKLAGACAPAAVCAATAARQAAGMLGSASASSAACAGAARSS